MSPPHDSTINDHDNDPSFPFNDGLFHQSDFAPAFDRTFPARDTPDPFFDRHFQQAYYRPPSQEPFNLNFLDNILNPAGLDHDRFSPFDYRPSLYPSMAPSTRTNSQPSSSRPARLPNGYVDLTASTDSPPQRRKRESPEAGPSTKRQKCADGTAAKSKSPVPQDIEEVDLTEDKPSIAEVLRKQREDAIKAQSKPEEKATTFNNFNCVICMDTPTDLTATACGHLFCHTCLMEALIAGESRSGPGEQKRSQCPVCRKIINRNKASDIIPLSLKKGLMTQPRRKAASASASTSAAKA